MKKISLFLFALMGGAMNVFASPYSRSDAEGFLTFLGFIMLAWGILEIILFMLAHLPSEALFYFV